MADEDFDLPPPPEESSSSAPAAAAANPFAARAAAFRSGTTPVVTPAAASTASSPSATTTANSNFKPVAFGGAKPPGAPGGGTALPPGFQPIKLAGGPPGSPAAAEAVSPQPTVKAAVLPAVAVTPLKPAVNTTAQTVSPVGSGRTSIDVSTIVVTYKDDQRWALGLPCFDLPEFREKQLIEEKAKKDVEKKEKEGKEREAKEREERDKKSRAEIKQEEQRQQKLAKELKEKEEREAAEKAKRQQQETIAAAIAKAKEDKKKKEEGSAQQDLPPPPEEEPAAAEDPFAARANAFRSGNTAVASATPPGFHRPGTASSPPGATAKPATTGPPGPPFSGGVGAGANSSAIAQAAAARAAAAASLRKANEEASPTPAPASGGHASPYTRGVTSPYRRQVPVAVEIAQPVKNSRYTKAPVVTSQEELAREQKATLSQQQDAERKRYDDFKKNYVPKPKREFPMAQRQQLLNIIQGCSILASVDGGSGGMQVSVDDLDKVLSEAGSLAGAETYLAHMQNTGKRCHGFDALVEGVAEAREQLAAEKTKLAKFLGIAWKENVVTELFEGCCAAGNTLSYVRQFCPLPHKPENVGTMIATIKAAITAQKEKGKNDLIKYFSSNECSLFTGSVALKQSDLRKLIATGGGYAPLILANLKCLDALGERFGAFTELEAAMTNKRLVEFKQELLTSLFRLRTALFKTVLKVPINAEAVNTLLADGQGALSTLEILELVASGAEEPFQTINEVAENVRSFADLRTEAVVREINAVFSFMERNGVFSVTMSATSGDVKKVVEAIFDANYGITGGDCATVLKQFTDRRQTFTSFPELLAAIKNRAQETEMQNMQLVQQSAGGILSWNAAR